MPGNDDAVLKFRINVTVPLLDEILESVKTRLGNHQCEIAPYSSLHVYRNHLEIKVLFPFTQMSTHYMLSFELWYEKWRVLDAKLIKLK